MTAYIIVTFEDGSSLETFTDDDTATRLVVYSDSTLAWQSIGGK